MTSPSRADAVANRSRLIAAAREVFIERGIEADIREICARAGVGPGTFYRNFATKEDLVLALIAEALREVHAFLTEAEQLEDPEAALLLVVDRISDLAERNRELARVLAPNGVEGMREIAGFEETRLRLQRLIERAVEPDTAAARYPSAFLVDVFGVMVTAYLDLRENWDPEMVRRFMREFFSRGFPPQD